jgi:sugar phosphate isomerase/epimerase
VPGLKLAFDTGNPVFTDDRGQPKPYPKQSAWDFYRQVRGHVAYVHIKDGRWAVAEKKTVYTFPGEGVADVRRIVKDLIDRGYAGGISIEPHLAVVHHDKSITSSDDIRYANYVEYGQRMQAIITELGGAARLTKKP